MKKILICILLFSILLTSCSKEEQSLVYYGYFSDQAVAVIYSAPKKTLYDIKLPLDLIISWGANHGIDNISDAIRSFCGLEDRAFMFGSSDTFESVCKINSALSLDIIAFKDKFLLANLSRLCSADFSELAETITRHKVKFQKFDTSLFADYSKVEQSHLYLKSWIRQVLGE